MKSLLKNFRKKTKSTIKEQIAIIVRKRDEKTSRRDRHDIKKSRKNRQNIKENRKKHDIQKIKKEHDFKWLWNRKFYKSESRISFLALDRETKRHRHRNTKTISNNRHRINKIIFFDRWNRWNHRQIKQTKTTNFITN